VSPRVAVRPAPLMQAHRRCHRSSLR
jgi:hypothetical protein